MAVTKIYAIGNYFVFEVTGKDEPLQDAKSAVRVWLKNDTTDLYHIQSPLIGNHDVLLSDMQDESGTPYPSKAAWETFYEANTGFDPASGSGASLNNTVFANSKSDLPTPVAGVISIDKVYLFGDNIDITGDRIVLLEGGRITCHGASTNVLSSTGINPGDYLITCVDVNASVSNIAIDCSGAKFINYLDSTNSKTLGITQTSISNSTDLGIIDGGIFHRLFGNAFPNCSGGFTVQGILDELEILNNSIVNWTGTPTFLTIPSGMFHSINIGYNSLHIEVGHTGLNISEGITLTAGGLISNNFFQNGGVYLAGIDATSPGWRIPPNSNVGIAGLARNVQSPIQGSWSHTSDVFIEMTDPAAPGEDPVFIGTPSSYEEDATKLSASFTAEVTHDQTGEQIAIDIYNTTDNLSMGFGGEAKLDVNTIAWQSGNTIRYTFNSVPDLSQVKVNDQMIIDSATNASNNGTFEISAFNDGADWIEITNPARTDATDDEAADSSALAHGGSVRYLAITTANVYESITTELFGLDENKSYTPRLRRASTAGGNPSVYIRFGIQTTNIF